MQTEIIEKLGELIEQSAHASELLIASEIAINNGEITASQKHTKEAQSILNVMNGDIFEEIEECFEKSNKDSADYDIPTPLELVRILNDLLYNSGVLLGVLCGESNKPVSDYLENAILKDINAVKEINDALFNN